MQVNGADMVARSTELMSQVITNAVTQSTELAEKMVKMSVETKLAVNKMEGMGEIIDTFA